MNRLAAIDNIRSTLRSGQSTVGSWIQIPDASLAEIMGAAGYDWVAIDLEHGSVSHHQLPSLCRSLELGNTLPLVRLAEGNPVECKRALDAGAGGVIVPMIESAAELERVRDVCRWPPRGHRGVGFSRANLFGKNFDIYQEEAQAPLLVAMIENARALKHLEHILSVEGLDAILIGPYDLSASMGITANFEHQAFKIAIEQIRRQAELSKVPVGLHVVQPSEEELGMRLAEGYRFLAFSIDAVFLRTAAQRPFIV